MKQIADSELIINADGSIFHLHLKPEQIAGNIILVGDPDRVSMISGYFEKVEYKVQNREFITHTGMYNGKRISVIATGIGTDNIDIVVNELDALANIDLKSRTIKKDKKKLNLIRIGTCGGLQEDLPTGSFIMSEMSIGFDGMLNFYEGRDKVSDLDMEKEFVKYMSWNSKLATPYFVHSSEELLERLGNNMKKGLTISAPGFYGPQGRELRLNIQDRIINDKIRAFRYGNKRITNYEMESSALAGLSALLGHNAVTVCVIIANRYAKEFDTDYKFAMVNLVRIILDRI
jgi:uridine phosphorylase